MYIALSLSLFSLSALRGGDYNVSLYVRKQTYVYLRTNVLHRWRSLNTAEAKQRTVCSLLEGPLDCYGIKLQFDETVM